jgi:FMN phosphatase YigB (HAD superfamily)
MTAFDTILPDTQALEALELLREADEQWDIWILSDGDYNDALQLLKRNELSGYIKDNILCCDDLRISKPHPKVYSELMRMAVHKTQRIEVIIVDKNIYAQYLC